MSICRAVIYRVVAMLLAGTVICGLRHRHSLGRFWRAPSSLSQYAQGFGMRRLAGKHVINLQMAAEISLFLAELLLLSDRVNPLLVLVI